MSHLFLFFNCIEISEIYFENNFANSSVFFLFTTGTKVVSAHAQFVVPEGYLLLEYFGEHDFGWVKAESVTAMYTYTPTADG